MGVQTFAGKTVVITGSSGGLGLSIGRRFAAAGAQVVLTDINTRQGQSAAESLCAEGASARFELLDVRSPEQSVALVEKLVEELGGIDVWVNNAGADILTGAHATLTNIEKLDLLLSVDLRGTMLASWQAARILCAQDAGGVIINMSWDHVLTGMPGVNPQMFAAVKGAVLAFSKSLARSIAPRVRVNVIAPGWIETSFAEGMERDRRDAIAESTPLKRLGVPEDVAGAAVFLASPAASFLTGQTINIGGGVVMG